MRIASGCKRRAPNACNFQKCSTIHNRFLKGTAYYKGKYEVLVKQVSDDIRNCQSIEEGSCRIPEFYYDPEFAKNLKRCMSLKLYRTAVKKF
ncbi:MAG: hypothetical protein GY874_00115 [Desulfobacteraceae bacterium]|nr:hypothetical protein [Desulfobacteraceae bacterium]